MRLNSYTIFLPQIFKIMEQTKSTGKYWLLFFISLAGMIAMMVYKPEFFWVVLPFVGTYFAKAMDLL
jgi:hypothetical protein